MSDLTIFATIISFVAFISIVGITLWRQDAAEERLRRSRNFDWFRSTHSNCVQGSRVACPHCRGTRVHVRSLMQQTFMREHFCATCGKTLYYSPEASA
jgi:hypothetical protein